MQGANFTSARLDKADMTGGVQAQGANFLLADAAGRRPHGCSSFRTRISPAPICRAPFNFAQLQAANLRDADLEGASLIQAWLLGADLTDAKITGAGPARVPVFG